MPQRHFRTCHLCEANCGLVIEVEGQDVLRISGDAENPLSRGYICPKATAIVDIENDPDRLRKPVKRVDGRWTEIGWEQAFDEIAGQVSAILSNNGLVTTYIGNPAAHNYSGLTQIPFLKAALGMPATFSAATIDNMPNMIVQLMMYGHNFLYAVPDIERTQFMLIIGGNPIASNGSLWTAPGVRTRFAALQARGGHLVTVDPRRTETAKLADEHVFIRPATDAAFLVAMLLSLDEAGLVAPGRLSPMLLDWDTTWAALRRFRVDSLATHCGVPAVDIRRLAADFAQAGPAIAYGRMGVSTQAFGTMCQWLIQLLNIATGNLDRPGGPMFGGPALDVASLTPGGTYDRFRSRVSGYPETLNEFPVAALAEEILTPGDRRIRGLITYAGNPVLSTPDGVMLDEALDTLDVLVSIDMYVNETTRHAHYILPPCGPLQKDHYPWYLGPMMVRNFAHYSPAVFPVAEGGRSDWQILQELGIRIGQKTDATLPPPREPRAVLDGALRASPRHLTLDDIEAHPHGLDLGPLESVLPGRLKTDDQMIHCAPAMFIADLERLDSSLNIKPPENALMLVGRRHVRNNNSWMHNSHRLAKGPGRCTLFMHPDDAARRNLTPESVVEIRSGVGAIIVRIEVTPDIMPGVASLPHGFGHDRDGVALRIARAHQPGVSFNDLTDHKAIDPISGNAAVNGIFVHVSAAAPDVAATYDEPLRMIA